MSKPCDCNGRKYDLQQFGIGTFKKDGVLVYLQLRYDEIESRLADISGRGVAMEKGQTLIGLYSERVPLYEKHADITVNVPARTWRPL